MHETGAFFRTHGQYFRLNLSCFPQNINKLIALFKGCDSDQVVMNEGNLFKCIILWTYLAGGKFFYICPLQNIFSYIPSTQTCVILIAYDNIAVYMLYVMVYHIINCHFLSSMDYLIMCENKTTALCDVDETSLDMLETTCRNSVSFFPCHVCWYTPLIKVCVL